MDNITKISNSISLEEKKSNLKNELELIKKKIKEKENELALTNKQIENNENNCLHILVNLGSSNLNSFEVSLSCLLCGKKTSFSRFAICNDLVVDASSYLTDEYPVDSEERFSKIRTIVVELIKSSPSITNEEIVIALNKIIKNSAMERLGLVLKSIAENAKDNGEEIIISKCPTETDTLQYGIFLGEQKKLRIENLYGEYFWEFVYNSIYKVMPESVVNFEKILPDGAKYNFVNIFLNNNVRVTIMNAGYQCNKFVFDLASSMENDEDMTPYSKEAVTDVILCKKIKPFQKVIL